MKMNHGNPGPARNPGNGSKADRILKNRHQNDTSREILKKNRLDEYMAKTKARDH